MSKITIKPSIAMLNSIDVVLTNESHTVAAPLVERMNTDKSCVFSAYKIAHPFDEFVSFKVQGNDKKNAKGIFEDALRSIISDLQDLIEQVKKDE